MKEFCHIVLRVRVEYCIFVNCLTVCSVPPTMKLRGRSGSVESEFQVQTGALKCPFPCQGMLGSHSFIQMAYANLLKIESEVTRVRILLFFVAIL